MMKTHQLKLFKPNPTSYGGVLLNTRKGRSRPRPLATRHSMHLVLRSSQAKGELSFRRPPNRHKIENLLKKFTQRFAVTIHSFANVGNHLHLHFQLSNRHSYKPFIRALTAAIAMAITGVNRWTKAAAKTKTKFWDRRPFTRIVIGQRDFTGLRKYLRINQLEGLGYSREVAKIVREWQLATGADTG